MKKITNSAGKNLYIFDDLFTYEQRCHFTTFAQQQNYSPKGMSIPIDEYPESHFRYNIPPQDLRKFALFENKNGQLNSVNQILDKRTIKRTWLLLSDLCTKIYYHTDYSSIIGDNPVSPISLLYFVNLNWKPEWGGETIFADESGDAEIAVSYKPGRLVLFDSFIVHKAGCVSSDAPLRYTFNCVFV